MIKDVIKSAVSDHSDLDHAPFWELLKYFIRRESMSYSKRKAHDRNCKEKAILAEISACENSFNANPCHDNMCNLELCSEEA